MLVTLPAGQVRRYADEVTQETAPVTDGYPVYAMNDREILEAIYTRLAVLEAEMQRLLGAWSTGGLRGLRKAAGNARD